MRFAPSLGTQGRPSGQLQGEEPERKQDKQKLQQAFGRHAGSGTVRAHKELTVSAVALRIPAVYSPPDTHITFTQRRHTEQVEPGLVCIIAAASFRPDVERDPPEEGGNVH